MKSKCLTIGISTVSVILLIFTSLTNVVGYQTVQISKQNLIKERINQRELLFQTIVDIANNKEIQRIILINQLSQGEYPIVDVPVVTKYHLRQIYFIGGILSKFISISTIQSIVRKYQFSNQKMQKEISTIIEKDAIFKGEITQLKNSECGCENINTSNRNYTSLCILLFPLYVLSWLYGFSANVMFDILNLDRNNKLIFLSYLLIIFPFVIIFEIGWRLNCFWGWKPYPPTRR